MFLVSLYVAEHVVWVVLVVPHLERLETEYLSLIKLFPLFADISCCTVTNFFFFRNNLRKTTSNKRVLKYKCL